MNPQCQQYRSAIPDLVSRVVTPERTGDVQRHLHECPDCRKYFESLQCDDGLLMQFTDLMRPSVAAVEAAVIGSLADRSDKSMPMLLGSSPGANWLKLAVAAAIVLAILGVVGYMFRPSTVSTTTLAQTLEAMRRKPWVHSVTREQSAQGVSRREDWERSDFRIRASKMPNGFVYYVSVSQNAAYSYDPNSSTITVSFADDHPLSQHEMPVGRLSAMIRSAQQGGARIRMERGPLENRHSELIRLDFTGRRGLESVAITCDTERNLLIRVEQNTRRDLEKHRVTTTFDYPNSGPVDIYALGVPADAAVRDLRPTAPAPVRVEQVGKPVTDSNSVSDGNAVAPSERRSQDEPPAAAPAQPPTQGISGVVKDEQGETVAGATIVLFHKYPRWGLDDKIVQTTATDPNGRYRLTAPIDFEQITPHDYAQDTYILFAIRPDHALAWQNIRQGQTRPTYDLVLTRATTRTITVIDETGKPVPGARAWLYEAGDRTSSNPLFRDYFLVESDVGLVGGITDVNGSAMITNLPATGCCFYATLRGFAPTLAFSGQDHIHLTPGADVSGWVLTPTGVPVSGAIVRLEADWMHSHFLARSDGQGRFEFRDLPAGGWDMSAWGGSKVGSGTYTVALEHADYAAPDSRLALAPRQVIDDLVITVAAETTLVKCLVVEERTDKPVPGARISGQNKIGGINGYSDADGIFTVRVIPGPTSLSFQYPPNGVYVLEEYADGSTVRFEAQGREMNVVVKSSPIAGRLVKVQGTVLRPDRTPLAGAVVCAAAGRFYTATAVGYVRPTGTDAGGRFELKEVPAGRDLHLLGETKDHTLAVTDVVHVPDDVNELPAVELILQPTQSCAVVVLGKDGGPAIDTALTVAPMVEAEGMWMSSAARDGRTDGLGVLQMDGIIPGLAYRLRDARFDEVSGPLPDGHEKWLDCEMVLIPLK